MVQITFAATTATTVAHGTDITTGNVQVLPDWAPPIEYIGTTTPWLAIITFATTTTTDRLCGHSSGKSRHIKIRAYGTKANLHDGKECISLASAMSDYGAKALITITYRAVGELTRPL